MQNKSHIVTIWVSHRTEQSVIQNSSLRDELGREVSGMELERHVELVSNAFAQSGKGSLGATNMHCLQHRLCAQKMTSSGAMQTHLHDTKYRSCSSKTKRLTLRL
jgi:hypothetical protein